MDRHEKILRLERSLLLLLGKMVLSTLILDHLSGDEEEVDKASLLIEEAEKEYLPECFSTFKSQSSQIHA